MKVEEGLTVTIEYKIETDKGELIESSLGKGAPLEFVCGDGHMMPGVEKRIVGMEDGEEKEFEVPPEEAFGAVDSGPVKEMEKNEFPKETVFKTGEKFTARLPEDQGNVIFEIVENRPTTVLVRFHLPHEGKTLKCKVKVLKVRSKAKPPPPPPSRPPGPRKPD
jgi:FKBP-type peptidyl-prolyl cis-trans isomerase 2